MSRILEPVQQLTSEFFIKQLRCNWNFTVHNGALLLVLLFFLQFSFLLWTKLGLFLFFPFAFIFASLITHICFSVTENDCSCTSREFHAPHQACVSVTCPAYSRDPISTRPGSSSGRRVTFVGGSGICPSSRFVAPRSPSHPDASSAPLSPQDPIRAETCDGWSFREGQSTPLRFPPSSSSGRWCRPSSRRRWQ